MARRPSARFVSIRTEGGLLPSELLQRLVERDAGLDGLTDASYHLVDGTRLAMEGLKKRYPDMTQAIKDRFEMEIGVIEDMGYAPYFLIVSDFTDYARKNGVAVGPGRGVPVDRGRWIKVRIT